MNEPLLNSVKKKNCSTCGNSFDCGDNPNGDKCWCNDFPPLFLPSDVIDCLCPSCFKESCSAKIDEYVSTITTETAKESRAKDLPKKTKLIEGIDYYLENENYVFKKWYHLKRGYCCKNNCRHCPYNTDK